MFKQIQESHMTPTALYPKRPPPRYIVVNLPKTKGKGDNLKTVRENCQYKEKSIRLTDFMVESQQKTKECDDIFRILKEKKKNFQP